MNETSSTNQDILINQFLSLEIDKQISKSMSPGKESKSIDGNEAKTDTEQDVREDSPTKQTATSIISVNSYFENFTINSTSTPNSAISSGLLSSSNSVNANTATQGYQFDYNVGNQNDDILSFTSSNSGLISAIDSKVILFFSVIRIYHLHLNLFFRLFSRDKKLSLIHI